MSDKLTAFVAVLKSEDESEPPRLLADGGSLVGLKGESKTALHCTAENGLVVVM